MSLCTFFSGRTVFFMRARASQTSYCRVTSFNHISTFARYFLILLRDKSEEQLRILKVRIQIIFNYRLGHRLY